MRYPVGGWAPDELQYLRELLSPAHEAILDPYGALSKKSTCHRLNVMLTSHLQLRGTAHNRE